MNDELLAMLLDILSAQQPAGPQGGRIHPALNGLRRLAPAPTSVPPRPAPQPGVRPAAPRAATPAPASAPKTKPAAKPAAMRAPLAAQEIVRTAQQQGRRTAAAQPPPATPWPKNPPTGTTPRPPNHGGPAYKFMGFKTNMGNTGMGGVRKAATAPTPNGLRSQSR